jgi:hypothetical protein
MWSDIVPPPSALPETIAPIGPGYMPLYCAAQWIATEGGKRQFIPDDQNIWKAAFDALLARIASDQVKVTGDTARERELIPGYHFAGCRVDLPFADVRADLLLAENLYLSSHPYIDEQHWRGGFDDALLNRHQVRWSRLMVLKEDIARYWPFSHAPTETGAPGRPSSMYLVEAEFKARCTRGAVAANLSGEAETLAKWLHDAHPDKPPLKPKSICNNLRAAFRQYHNAQN